jgi:hypothetical protein
VAGGVLGRGSEAAARLAEQHRDVVGALIRHGQVGIAVAVELSHRDGDRPGADGEVRLGCDAAVRPTQQHLDATGIGAPAAERDRQVRIAVVVEVPNRRGSQLVVSDVGVGRPEASARLTEQFLDQVPEGGRRAHDREIRIVVAVEVPDHR